MFGFHNSDNCAFDIWAPIRNVVENRAFSAYALHAQELEDIIELIGNGITDIEYDENLTTLDKQYIKDEVLERYGVEVDFT